MRGLIVLLCLLIFGELAARFIVGLGDPPLVMADQDMEYRFRPSMTYRRLGNHIHYNAWSMRSEDFAEHRTSAGELRVMVFGDSVINGGAPTDDSQLATRLLESELGRDIHRPVIVGNISAASWGPENMLAYAKKFGFFDADVVVIVVSSHDYADVMTFKPVVDVDPAAPGTRPWSALQEAISRYLWPRLFGSSAPSSAPPGVAADDPPQADIDRSVNALRDLIKLAQVRGAKVILAQHLGSGEPVGHELPGHAILQAVGKECGVPVVQLGPAMEEARRQGTSPWRDNIHPNARGQQIIATVLEPAIMDALVRKPASTQASRLDSESR